jgi:Lysine methyltransferase
MTYNNNKNNTTESDDFWKIACLYDNKNPSNSIVVVDDGGDDEHLKESVSSSTSSLYKLDISPFGRIDLNLTPILPSPPLLTIHVDDDVVPILGADVWYGSAILSALFQQINCYEGEENVIQSYLNQYFYNNRNDTSSTMINILELGSGAVGLTGIVVGLSINGYIDQIISQKRHENYHSKKMNCRVILTDHEPNVMQQLQYNIKSTILNLEEQFPYTDLPEYIVHNLDWNDDTFVLNGDICTSSSSSSSNCCHVKDQQQLQLVIGSELIYNHETAHACIKIVLQLLRDHPNVLVVLVQMTDREGWDTIFLPTLLYQQQSKLNIVMESSILRSDLYELACKLIQPGGTLNPLCDYTICYIRNETV